MSKGLVIAVLLIADTAHCPAQVATVPQDAYIEARVLPSNSYLRFQAFGQYHPVLPDSLQFERYLTHLDTARLLPEYDGWLNEPYGGKKSLRVKPEIMLEAGMETGAVEGVTGAAAGGLTVYGRPFNKTWLELSGIGGLFTMPAYIGHLRDSTHVFPGMSKAFGDDPASAYLFRGHFSYRPSQYFMLTVGHDKHFIGDGYRSLLLSDFSNAYPFLEFRARVWHLDYTVLYSWLRDIPGRHSGRTGESNKFSTTHLLTWKMSKNAALSFFESIIWQGKDAGAKRGFDVNYLNPVIFYRPVEYAQGSADNALMGLNLSVRTPRSVHFYGQFLIDEFLLKELRAGNGWWANKFGWQLGVKVGDIGLRDALSLRAEFNTVRPFTYSHASEKQSYTHYGLPLAHPLGSNFREYMLTGTWQRNRWQINDRLMYARYGRDPDSLNLGGDIYESYRGPAHAYNNTIGQGVPHKLWLNELRGSYLFDSALNLRGFASYIYRRETIEGSVQQTHWLSIGITTSPGNFYRTF